MKKWIYISPTNLGILLSHLLFLSLSKLSRNWIWDTAINLKYKISRRSSRSSDNAELVISRCCFAEDGKEMYKKPLFCSLNLLFSDVPVAVAVVVILNFLITDCACVWISSRIFVDWAELQAIISLVFRTLLRAAGNRRSSLLDRLCYS